MTIQTHLFINNEYVPSSTGETLSIYNPSDDSLVTDKVQVASEADVDKAVASAKAAFPSWSSRPGIERGAIMNRFADLLEKNATRLAKLESLAMGQPVALASSFFKTPVSLWRYYAGFAGKIAGRSYAPDGDSLYKIVAYEPLGVCAAIIAWNVTHTLISWKMGPALAAGNTCVIKTSEKSPLAAAAYGDLIIEAGFPPGVINIISGGGNVGALLSSHMQIEKISFTGSTNTGRAVQIAATKSNMKHVTLELGGKSPSIIFDDADLENAVLHNSSNFLRNSGQICVASSRVLVQEGIAPKFIEAIKVAFENAEKQMGDSSLESTVFGPLADKSQLERVMEFIQQAQAEGVQVLAGGNRKGNAGAFVQPTVLLTPDTNAKVYREEIFGPVICLKTFKTEEEAIQLANDTTYGLGATVYTSDIARALRIANNVEAGTVSINRSFIISPQTPVGGYKQSGYGREGGIEGLYEYLQTKTIHINLDLKPKV